jgi:beta-phosphoglucomutase-like phosphatase (HAD superfamily)
VGDYFARYGGLADTTHALHALTPPAAASRDWRSLLTVADRMVANARRQIAAAHARDSETFVQTVHAVPNLVDQLKAAAKRIGIRSTSPCAQVFG